jgi:uncharacterized membrane protein YphA (DoxX/SURF4 family)
METTPFVRRFAVRAGIAVSALTYLPSPFDSLPVVGEVLWDGNVHVWMPVVRLAGKLFGATVPDYQMTGSGDTLFDWLRLLCVVVLGLSLGTAWTLAEKRLDSSKLQDVLVDYLRLVLMMAMFSYGWSKVTLGQFPPLADWRLAQTYADSSPMGLLWRFMAFSPIYERFAGGLEVLSAVLLVSRRTATLGALVAMGVMANVVMLNFCFDVPVKGYSMILLFTAVAIAAPSAKRLFQALVLGQAVEAADVTPKYLATGKRRWARMAPFGGFALLSLYVFLPSTEVENRVEQKGPFTGEYVVVDQSAGPREQTVSITDWTFKLKPAVGPLVQWKCDQSKEKKVLMLASMKDPNVKPELKFEEAGDGKFRVSGDLNGTPLDLLIRRAALKDGELLTRGFHWVSEFPYNR